MCSNKHRRDIDIRSPASAEEFSQYYRVRWQTLRAPWGEPEGSEKDERENETFHLAAFINNQVVGVARIQKNSASEAQIRYMGVLKEHRGRGIGRLLVEGLEEEASQKGFSHIILNARESAVAFYIVLGYEVVEESYLLFDSIQHYQMRKFL